jgi:CHAT domain-containing protein
MDQAQPQRSKILLEDDLINFRTTAVDRDPVRMGIGKHHPFVFLNACQLSAEGMVLSLGSGWPQAFLDVGASAFIGPLWSVQDESARDAAKHFYEELRLGKSMGEALQTMRKKWVDGGSVTFLAYTLYGDPAAKVVRV